MIPQETLSIKHVQNIMMITIFNVVNTTIMISWQITSAVLVEGESLNPVSKVLSQLIVQVAKMMTLQETNLVNLAHGTKRIMISVVKEIHTISKLINNVAHVFVE